MNRKVLLFGLLFSCVCCVAKTGKEIIAEKGFKTRVLPLLTTQWSQDGGENSMLPYIDEWETRLAATGCGATALGQVMNYWKYPLRGHGSNYYYWEEIPGLERVMYADFGSTYYDWNNMASVYKGKTVTQAQIDAVSTLMLHIGIALEMKYKYDEDKDKVSTATNIEYIHTILKKYFGYNPDMRLVRQINGDYSLDEWLAMIYKELSEGRPVLMGGTNSKSKNHIFVADGYNENGEVHLNLGHANINNENKYYDLSRTDQTYTINMRMILGLCPGKVDEEPKTVNVSTPGTLLEVLGGEQASRKTCRLRITGSINSDDFKLLEKLTRTTTGQLSYLDLSGCRIEGNAIPDDAFNDTREGSQSNSTLQEIILPDNVLVIGKRAFRNCTGLYSVHFPSSLQHINNFAFSNCRYLSEVNLPSTLTSVGTNPFRFDKFDNFGIAPENQYMRVTNHALLSKDGKTLYSMQFKCLDDYRVPTGVETISQQAFYKCCGMTSLIFPASLKQINANAIYQCYRLNDVYSHAIIAPVINGSFDASVYASTLHVPAGCIDEYRQKGWTMFADIVDDVQKSYDDIIAENGFKIEVRPLIQTTWSRNDDVTGNHFPTYLDEGTVHHVNPSGGAVVMAQMMNYWKYPATGNDELSFVWQSPKGENVWFSANFATSNYDWDNMDYDTNTNDLTVVQKEAIATLVYHCGVATFNKQNPEYSDEATQMEYCSSAMKKYFGYNKDMHILNANFYNKLDWAMMIYRELSEGKPVMIENTTTGDEVSIIDGYDIDGLLHIRKDGRETYLSPDDAQVYSQGIYILVGIQPNDEENPATDIFLSSTGTLAEVMGECYKTTTKLKLRGTLNTDDISFLKTMGRRQTGQLYFLDLSDAIIEGNALNGYSFQFCDLLQYVKLPTSLEIVGRHEFSYCYNLLNIEFPQVKSIGNYAFFYCRYMDSVHLPSSLTSIGDNPFGSNKMSSFIIDNNYVFKIEDKTLLSMDGRYIYSCQGSYQGEYRIPDGVTQVKNMAFRGCDGITSVIIPKGTSSIGTYAFYDCHNLKDVYSYSRTAPNLSPNISSYAFYPEHSNCTLHVPTGCIDEYKQKNWDKFARIVDDLQDSEELMGDVNGDGEVNIGDVVLLVNHILGKATGDIHLEAADQNGDNAIDIADIVAIIQIILTQN